MSQHPVSSGHQLQNKNDTWLYRWPGNEMTQSEITVVKFLYAEGRYDQEDTHPPMKSLIPWNRADTNTPVITKHSCLFWNMQIFFVNMFSFQSIDIKRTMLYNRSYTFKCPPPPPPLTLSCSGFSSSLSLRRSWSAVVSSWLICSVASVSASSSWLSFSTFCFCSLPFMRSSSSWRKSFRRLNSAVTSSSRSPACSWKKERRLCLICCSVYGNIQICCTSGTHKNVESRCKKVT